MKIKKKNILNLFPKKNEISLKKIKNIILTFSK
jgi:hypothetical protein